MESSIAEFLKREHACELLPTLVRACTYLCTVRHACGASMVFFPSAYQGRRRHVYMSTDVCVTGVGCPVHWGRIGPVRIASPQQTHLHNQAHKH